MTSEEGNVRRSSARLAVISVLICSLCACAPSKGPDEKFRIGTTLPLTGIFGKAGNLVKDAYTIWSERVNARGGINGHPVELIYYDNKSDRAVAAKLVEKLITDDKVDLLLGGFGSSLVFAGSTVAEKYKYPLISGAASSNKLFERGFRYYFSTLGKATEEIRGCVEVFKTANPRPKTAAIVGADILFTSLACEGYRKYCGQEGIEVVHFELFPLALRDYNSLLAKVKAKKPDVLLVGSHLLVAMRMIKAMKEIDFSPNAVAFSYGPTVPKFVEDLGKDADYVIAASEWTSRLPYKGPVFGSAGDFDKEYFKRFKRHPDFVEAAAAGGAVVQQLVVQALGFKPPLSRENRIAIGKMLHADGFETFYGRVEFGKDGANVAHPPIAVQVQQGKLKTIYPEANAEAKIIYPLRPWKER
jgi:branched-chain amino acid transport system substrate-binding protein